MEEVPTLNLTWRGMSLDSSIRGIGYIEDKEVAGIFIPNGGFSGSYDYTGPLPMLFAQAGQTETPLEELIVLARVNLPIETREALFFFDHSGSDGDLRVFPVALDPEPLLPGQVLAINTSERTIAGFHDGKRFELPSGRTTVFTPDQSGDSQAIQVSVQLATMEEDGWQARVNSRYGMTPDMRVRLLFRSGKDGSIKIIPLRERAPRSLTEQATELGE